MVIKVYTSGISGNKEVKKRQQRILMILESKSIEYIAIDITEPGNEEEKHFMQENAEARDSKHPLPPQIFNEQEYCGDYTGFDLANENDELEVFLKLPIPPKVNGQHSTQKDGDQQVPERNEDIINSMVPDTTTADEPTNKTKKVEDFEDMEEDKPENDSSVKEDEEMEQEEKSEEEGEAEVDEE